MAALGLLAACCLADHDAVCVGRDHVQLFSCDCVNATVGRQGAVLQEQLPPLLLYGTGMCQLFLQGIEGLSVEVGDPDHQKSRNNNHHS